MNQICKWLVVGAVVAGVASVASAQRPGESTMPRHCNAVKAEMQETPAAPKASAVKAPATQKSVCQKIDTNKDGKLTVKERQARQKEWLKELDTNKDGKLTLDEFGAKRMAVIDVDKNGVITLEEYLVFFAGVEAKADKSAACAKLDANGDKIITPVEVIAYRKSVYKTIDAKGKVTPDKMKVHAAKQFKDRDANKDGFVTVEEMIAVIAAPPAAAVAGKKIEKKKKGK